MANALEATLRHIASCLDARHQGWALVGGLAISVRSDPRLTRDADLAVSVSDDQEAEALMRSLGGDGYQVAAIVDHEPTGRLATARLFRASAPGLVVDLLFASCGIEPEIVSQGEVLEILPGLHAPVAGVGHLMAMKLLARDDRDRPLDAHDLQALARVATDDDWQTAAVDVRLIAERGFARGRDLVAALAELEALGLR